MRIKIITSVLWLLPIGFGSQAAASSTASASFGVGAIVEGSCQAAPTRPTFRNYAEALENARSSVLVSCTNPTPYNISVDTTVTTAPDIPGRKFGTENLAEVNVALPSYLLKTLTSTVQAGIENKRGDFPFQDADLHSTIDGSGVYPRIITVIISY